MRSSSELTVGSLFAGIGGFDEGFEQAGWKTKWQVEINPVCRLVLAHHFPDAWRFEDVRKVGSENLEKVSCIVAGFPCQDISTMGCIRKDYRQTEGLKGERSSLFYEVVRILREIQPSWVVLENVPALVHTNHGRDLETVVRELAKCGYVGFFRVLDSQYFGVPQKRRRIFLVAGLGRFPPMEFLADSGQLVSLPCPLGSFEKSRRADSWASHTLLAKKANSQLGLGCEVLVAHEGGWRQNLKRARMSWDDGVRKGLDAANFVQTRSAGNAVVVPIARWIAGILASEEPLDNSAIQVAA